MQSPLILSAAYLVFRPREVIESDVPVPRFGKHLNRAGEDSELVEALGEEACEAPLLLLHPGHVSVVEHRNAIRIHRDDLVDRIAEALDGLMRQPVNQIDVDAFKSDLARVIEQPSRVFVRLHSMDGLLYKRIEILDAHAQSVEANALKRAAMLVSCDARINLDAD